MGVQIETTRVACDTSGGGTQDITITDFGTPKAALFIGVGATTDGTAASDSAISIGFTDGTNQRMAGLTWEDALSTTDTYRIADTAEVVKFGDQAGAVDGEANFNSWITDGVRLTWGNYPASGYLLTTILFAGSDLQAAVGSFTQPAGDTNTVDIEPGFEPDVVITIGTGGAADDDGSASGQVWLGIASNDGGGPTQACYAIASRDNQGTCEQAIRLANDRIAINLRGGFQGETSRAAELTAFNAGPSSPAAGFTCTTRDTRDSSAFTVFYLALAFGGAVSFSVDLLDAPTSTGSTSITAPGFQPGFVLSLLGTDDAYAGDPGDTTSPNADTFAVGVWDATNQYCNCVSSDDGAATTETYSLSDNQAINTIEGTNTTREAASFTSFDANGWTLNYTTVVSASARKQAALSIGVADESAAGSIPLYMHHYTKNLKA